MFIDDTIAAVATAPGEAGIGIVRLSGPKALDIANKIFKPIKGNTDLSMQVRKLVYGHVYDQDKVIDEVLVSYMKKPHTFTREDVVEINCHGGYISVRKYLNQLFEMEQG
jgi:tRNA modification GTPase trmE